MKKYLSKITYVRKTPKKLSIFKIPENTRSVAMMVKMKLALKSQLLKLIQKANY
jgi:hypothetical protein